MLMKKLLIVFFICVSVILQAAVPAVNFIYLYNDDDGQKTNPASSLTGNDYMTLWFQVKDNDGFTNIKTIDVLFWDSAHASLTDSNSDQYHAQYKFYREYSDWSLFGPFSWSINKTYCDGPDSSTADSNFHNFTLVFKPGEQAAEEYSKKWNITVLLTDHDGNKTNVSENYSLRQIEQSQPAGSGGVFYAAPNPLKIIDDNSLLHLYYEPGFSDNCRIKLQIYTIYGELVKTILSDKSYSANQTLSETWDGKNGAGLAAASGIYSAVLSINYDSGQKEKQYFKFAIYK